MPLQLHITLSNIKTIQLNSWHKDWHNLFFGQIRGKDVGSKLIFHHTSWRFFAKEVKNRLLKHKIFLNLEITPYDSPFNLILRILLICTKAGNKIFKIPHTGNGPEFYFFLAYIILS